VWDADTGTCDDPIGLQSFPVRQILLKEDVVLRDYKVRPDPPRPARLRPLPALLAAAR
jgi:hypothetical protein